MSERHSMSADWKACSREKKKKITRIPTKARINIRFLSNIFLFFIFIPNDSFKMSPK